MLLVLNTGEKYKYTHMYNVQTTKETYHIYFAWP